ncbi:MAG: hypothetical protein GXO33_01460 [Epsilonproteobacteria bacterium]|nr:hypothetical protein [Campylobacterota bacterium]
MKSLFSGNKTSGHRNILSVNAYQSSYYLYADNTLSRLDKPKFEKKNLIVSSLASKDFISTLIEVSSNVPEEDLQDTIEIKTYEDLGLDQEIEYVIRFVEAPEMRTQDTRFFHVFVTEASVIFETYADVVDDIKFIDFILPRPLLIKNLYKRNILASAGVQGYLYFFKEDAFIALYQDGNYFYSKPIKFTLEHIFERFCELFGERVDEETFYNMLEEQGLKTSNIEYQDILMKLFSEIFMHVNDILTYAKRAYNLEKIDLFYIGSVIGPILGLNEYAQTYLGIEAMDFDFDYDIRHDDWYIDQFHYLSVTEILSSDPQEIENLNFTLFYRPPPFPKRKSGQFILVSAAAILLALSVPIYNYVYDYYTKAAIVLLREKESKLRRITTALRNEIDALQKTKKSYQEKVAQEQEALVKKQKVLSAVYKKKVEYPMKATKIKQFADDMKPYRVKITKVTNHENEFIFSLIAATDKQITEYIKHITDKYGDEIDADIDKIYKNSESNVYFGDLKVSLK